MPDGHDVAQLARDSATDQNRPEYIEFSGLTCWEAAIRCAFKAGALTAGRHAQLLGVNADNYTDYVDPATDTLVANPADMQRVPQGAFLGFLGTDAEGSIPLADHVPGQIKLLHGMTATGAGMAAGNKNSCIGLGAPVGWEILNLAQDLRWSAADNGFNAHPVGRRIMQIYYRPI